MQEVKRNIWYKNQSWYYEPPNNLIYSAKGGGIILSLYEIENLVKWANKKKKQLEKQ
jgi:hypothetical protein